MPVAAGLFLRASTSEELGTAYGDGGNRAAIRYNNGYLSHMNCANLPITEKFLKIH